jgi:type 1 fimbria pilin
MTTSRLVRRSVAVFAATGAAAALSFVPAGSAQADVAGLYAAIGSSNVNYTGTTVGGECTLAVPDSDSVESPIRHFSHGTRAASVNLDATYTSSDNPSDTVRVKGHVDSTLTLKKHNRDLQSFALGVGGTVSVHHSLSGSLCSAQGTVAAVTQVTFTEHKKGWLTITRDTRKPNSVVELVLVNLKTQKLVTFDIFSGSQSHETSRALLKPGKYELVQTEAGISAGQNGIFLKSGVAPRAARAKLTIHLSGEFKPVKH